MAGIAEDVWDCLLTGWLGWLRMGGIVDRMAGMARMAELFLRMQRMAADPKMHP